MPAFKVRLNGKKLCVASLDGLGVLSAHVTWVCRKNTRKTLSLHVGGLNSSTGEHLVWRQSHPLRLGDTLSVDLLESGRADQPTSRKKPDPIEDLRAKKNYVRKLAKELGWRITTK